MAIDRDRARDKNQALPFACGFVGDKQGKAAVRAGEVHCPAIVPVDWHGHVSKDRHLNGEGLENQWR